MNAYEQKNAERINYLVDNYKTEEERNELKTFFLGMLEHLDCDTETRPIVAFSVPAETGTSVWRLLEPLFSLWKAHNEEFLFIYLEGELNNFNLINFVDIWVQHRAGSWHAYTVNLLKSYPKDKPIPVIIHDIDDNEFNLPKEHPFYKIWMDNKKDQMSMTQLKESDYITTTTKTLKNEFNQFNSNHKVKIIPNAVNFALPNWNREYVRPDKYKDKIVVGWCGLSHPEDLIYLAKVFDELYAKYGDKLFFIIAGINKYKATDSCKFEDSYEEFANKQFANLIKHKAIDIFEPKSFADYMTYYQMFDINTAYIVNRKWNTYKSNIKAMEAGALGKVTVMSNVGAYNNFTNELPISIQVKPHLLCSKNVPTEWVKNISYWIDNPELRIEIGQKICEYVRDSYDIKKVNELRYRLYKDILSKRLHPVS